MRCKMVLILTYVLFVLLCGKTVFAGDDVYTFRIPEQYGEIVQRYKGSSNDLYILIEDAHQSYAAQGNIAHIIQEILSRHDALSSTGTQPFWIGIEGAYDTIQYDALRNFPVPRVRDHIISLFMKSGYFVGSDSAAQSAPVRCVLKGLEDKTLLMNHVELFRACTRVRERYGAAFINSMSALSHLKKKIYNSRLYAFDRLCAREPNEETFREYTEMMLTILSEHEPDEARALQQRIEGMLSAHTAVSVVLDDIASSEQKVKQYLSTTENERSLITLDQALRMSKALLFLEAREEETALMQAQPAGYTADAYGLLMKWCMHENIPLPAERIPDGIIREWEVKSRLFYTYAQGRSERLITNVFQAMKESPQNIGVMVCGGYHTTDMTRVLREHGKSFLVMRPRIPHDDTPTGYYLRMMGALPGLNTPLMSYAQSTVVVHGSTRGAAFKNIVAACESLSYALLGNEALPQSRIRDVVKVLRTHPSLPVRPLGKGEMIQGSLLLDAVMGDYENAQGYREPLVRTGETAPVVDPGAVHAPVISYETLGLTRADMPPIPHHRTDASSHIRELAAGYYALPQEMQCLLSDVTSMQRVFMIAMRLRMHYGWKEYAPSGSEGPLAWALRHGIYLPLGEKLYITPVSESFRRHILFMMDENNQVTSCVEIKIPGEAIERREYINPQGYLIPLHITEENPSTMIRPLMLGSLPEGEYELYQEKKAFTAQEPCYFIAYEYQDGRRLFNVMKESAFYANEDVLTLIRTCARLLAEVHHTGYWGQNVRGGSDMHTENMRWWRDNNNVPHITWVADVESYRLCDTGFMNEIQRETDVYNLYACAQGEGFGFLLKDDTSVSRRMTYKEFLEIYREEYARLQESSSLHTNTSTRENTSDFRAAIDQFVFGSEELPLLITAMREAENIVHDMERTHKKGLLVVSDKQAIQIGFEPGEIEAVKRSLAHYGDRFDVVTVSSVRDRTEPYEAYTMILALAPDTNSLENIETLIHKPCSAALIAGRGEKERYMFKRLLPLCMHALIKQGKESRNSDARILVLESVFAHLPAWISQHESLLNTVLENEKKSLYSTAA